MNPNLIYDVGMHNGDDTAFYLRCGFNVIAIEANPGNGGPGLVHWLATEAQRDFLKVAVGVGGKYSRPPYLRGERR